MDEWGVVPTRLPQYNLHMTLVGSPEGQSEQIRSALHVMEAYGPDLTLPIGGCVWSVWAEGFVLTPLLPPSQHVCCTPPSHNTTTLQLGAPTSVGAAVQVTTYRILTTINTYTKKALSENRSPREALYQIGRLTYRDPLCLQRIRGSIPATRGFVRYDPG